MKVLLVNGSPQKNGCTRRALDECASVFEAKGIEVEHFWIGAGEIRGCSACMACRKTDHCTLGDENDPANKLIDAVNECDGVIIGSPVYYAGMNGSLKSILDRAFYAGYSGFVNKPAAAIASARRAGTTVTIDQINKYFQICGMPLASSTYWAMVHGTKPEDVEQDKEGLQTMRNLATQMAWMMQSFAAAKESGILPPELPRVERTNFIS